MDDISASTWIEYGCVAIVSVLAVITDIRSRRIPNALTLSSLLLGLVFRGVSEGTAGILDAGQAFALGFGTLFVLWMIGGGGGGDTKLMGALSVWLGWQHTLQLLILSAIVALVLQVVARRASFVDRPVPAKRGSGSQPAAPNRRNSRTRIAFAVPLALSTWVIVALDVCGVSIPL